MRRSLYIVPLVALVLMGQGCLPFGDKEIDPTAPADLETIPSEVISSERSQNVVLPIDQYGSRRTFKLFGEYFKDRFEGYHVADDIEYEDVEREIEVRAIADGTIRHFGPVDGYGGLIVIEHRIGEDRINAVYGHLDLGSSDLSAGDPVGKGQVIATLGDDRSIETDGERKHLHFALYEGEEEEVRLQGYEPHPAQLENWINPDDFYRSHGFLTERQPRTFYPEKDLGGTEFPIQFTIPAGWDAEYVPSIKSLNLYTVAGEGTSRERSQMFIRFFDAEDFLTLSTVGIFETTDLEIGKEDYTARRYDIEKRASVAPFRDQPLWRNERHIVTDFFKGRGLTRYFVVAANPELDEELYEQVLESMEVID